MNQQGNEVAVILFAAVVVALIVVVGQYGPLPAQQGIGENAQIERDAASARQAGAKRALSMAMASGYATDDRLWFCNAKNAPTPEQAGAQAGALVTQQIRRQFSRLEEERGYALDPAASAIVDFERSTPTTAYIATTNNAVSVERGDTNRTIALAEGLVVDSAFLSGYKDLNETVLPHLEQATRKVLRVFDDFPCRMQRCSCWGGSSEVIPRSLMPSRKSWMYRTDQETAALETEINAALSDAAPKDGFSCRVDFHPAYVNYRISRQQYCVDSCAETCISEPERRAVSGAYAQWQRPDAPAACENTASDAKLARLGFDATLLNERTETAQCTGRIKQESAALNPVVEVRFTVTCTHTTRVDTTARGILPETASAFGAISFKKNCTPPEKDAYCAGTYACQTNEPLPDEGEYGQYPGDDSGGCYLNCPPDNECVEYVANAECTACEEVSVCDSDACTERTCTGGRCIETPKIDCSIENPCYVGYCETAKGTCQVREREEPFRCIFPIEDYNLTDPEDPEPDEEEAEKQDIELGYCDIDCSGEKTSDACMGAVPNATCTGCAQVRVQADCPPPTGCVRYVPDPNDTACDACIEVPICESDACTERTCENDRCVETPKVTCTSDACHKSYCNPQSGECEQQDLCRSDACLEEACVEGECVEVSRTTCQANDPCRVAYCDARTGCETRPLCSEVDNGCMRTYCDNGTCKSETLLTCEPRPERCETGYCASGTCVYQSTCRPGTCCQGDGTCGPCSGGG